MACSKKEYIHFEVEDEQKLCVIDDWCRFIQGTSAISGQGLYEGLEWLSKTIPNKPERSTSGGSFRSNSSERKLVRGPRY